MTPHRHYFSKKFDHIVEAELASRAAQMRNRSSKARARSLSHRFATIFRRHSPLSTVVEVTGEEDRPRDKMRGEGIVPKLRPDMIRRMNDTPKLVDPDGWISEGHAIPSNLNRVSASGFNRRLALADDKSLQPPSAPLDQAPGKYQADRIEKPNQPGRSYVLYLREWINWTNGILQTHPSTIRSWSSYWLALGRRSVTVCSMIAIFNKVIIDTNPLHRYETMNDESQNRHPSVILHSVAVEFAPTDPRHQREHPHESGSESSNLKPLRPDEQRKPLALPVVVMMFPQFLARIYS